MTGRSKGIRVLISTLKQEKVRKTNIALKNEPDKLKKVEIKARFYEWLRNLTA